MAASGHELLNLAERAPRRKMGHDFRQNIQFCRRLSRYLVDLGRDGSIRASEVHLRD